MPFLPTIKMINLALRVCQNHSLPRLSYVVPSWVVYYNPLPKKNITDPKKELHWSLWVAGRAESPDIYAIFGLYWGSSMDNGKENGNYYDGLYRVQGFWLPKLSENNNIHFAAPSRNFRDDAYLIVTMLVDHPYKLSYQDLYRSTPIKSLIID